MEDIYGRKLLLKERRFVCEQSSGLRGCQIELSRPNDINKQTMYFALVTITLLAIAYYSFQYITASSKLIAYTTTLFIVVVLIVFMFSDPPKVQDIGVQLITTQTTGLFWSRSKTTFLPLSHIVDIVINETFYRHKIVFYLVLLIKQSSSIEQDEERPSNLKDIKLIPLFAELLPRHVLLVNIYKTIKETLTPNDKKRN